MKPTKQTVYFELDGSEKESDKIYGIWDKHDFECGVTQKEGYFFTPEQLNQLLSDVIKDTLNTAADKAEITNKAKFSGDYNPVVDEESITNTFVETCKKFEV